MELDHSAEGVRISPVGFRRLALAGVLLACSWAPAAFGASSLTIDCDRAGNDFPRAEVSSKELSVSVIDLTDEETVGIDEARDADGSIAPLLYLAPRVATMLEDVFRGTDSNVDSAASESSSVAPVADSADEPAAPQATEADAPIPIDAHPTLLRIQREMYRTDI